MTIWQILGIEPTDDIRAIKHAYAKRSADVHPEEHPEEFRQLHDAYKEALERAEFIKHHPKKEPRQNVPVRDAKPAPQQAPSANQPPVHQQAPAQQPPQPSALNAQFRRRVYDEQYDNWNNISRQTAGIMQQLQALYQAEAKETDYRQLFGRPDVAALLDEPYFITELLRFLRAFTPDRALYHTVFNAYGFTFYSAEEQSARYELYRYLVYIYNQKTTYHSAFRKTTRQRKREKANKICFAVFTALTALWMIFIGVLFATDPAYREDTLTLEILCFFFYSIIGFTWWMIVLAVMKHNNK